MYKNIAKQEKLLLKNLVDYQAGQVSARRWCRMSWSASPALQARPHLPIHPYSLFFEDSIP